MEDGTFVDTGSPHLVKQVMSVNNYRVYDEGKKIRNGGLFKSEGVNVNFIEVMDDNKIFVRTYERGVENETLSCGTGVTASAIASGLKGLSSPIAVCTKGGNLEVDFEQKEKNYFTNVYLTGPAKPVFHGVIDPKEILEKQLI